MDLDVILDRQHTPGLITSGYLAALSGDGQCLEVAYQILPLICAPFSTPWNDSALYSFRSGLCVIGLGVSNNISMTTGQSRA